MGFALPAAQKLEITEEVIAVGDGGFEAVFIQRTWNDFQTSYSVKIVILNNEYLGMVRQWQQVFFDKRYASTEMTNPDFVTIAKGYFDANQTEYHLKSLIHQ